MLKFTWCLLALLSLQNTTSPRAVVDELLNTDRTYAAGAKELNTADAIAAMFAEDVTVPGPGNVFVQGKSRAVDALRSNKDNIDSRAEWAPIRGGISADGRHGFTFGYMTVVKSDGATVPLKYLAYWVKGSEGWRVAAYRRRPRPEGAVLVEMMPPSLPPRLTAPAPSPQKTQEYATSLSAAEQAFSDEAQKIGVGEAFAKYGRADAVNMGGPKDVAFVVGNEAIGRSIGAGSAPGQSEVEWNADRVLVASSGDLGITFGMIRIKQPEPNGPRAVPFFTIWRRDNPSAPWRYIAE